MLKRIIESAVFLSIASAAPGFAQSKVEASVLFGWGFTDGVSGQAVTAGNGRIYDRIDPKDAAIFGSGLGIKLSEKAEVWFLWSLEFSKLVAGGAAFTNTPDTYIGDMGLNNYHGYLAYNFMEADARIRPFIYGGLGATHFGSVDYSGQFLQGTIGGNTQFSTTWGAGVKFYVSPRIGFRFTSSWTPTYVKSDASGYWCDPYWGCYLVGDPQYSNQIQLNGGVTFRF